MLEPEAHTSEGDLKGHSIINQKIKLHIKYNPKLTACLEVN